MAFSSGIGRKPISFTLMSILIGPMMGLSVASAQEDSPSSPTDTPAQEKSIIKFTALVQHVNGKTERVEASKSRSPLTYQTPIYESERLHIRQDGHLKIITRNRCIGVIYSEGILLSPKGDKPWRTNSEALRWICPPGAKESISYKGSSVSLDGGELLIDNNQLLVLRGAILASGVQGPLPEKTLYRLVGRNWQAVTPTAEPYEVWAFSQERPAPAESTPLPEVKKPIKTRVILGPAFGSGQVFYDASSLNQNNLSAEGAHLQVHRRWETGSLIVGLAWREQQDNSRMSGPNQPPALGVSNTVDHLALEGGYRFSHDRWWSPFVKLGLGMNSAKVQIVRHDIGYYARPEYEFYILSASAGMDVMIRPEFIRWLGLYAAGQISLAQSVGRGAGRQTDYSYKTYEGPLPSEAMQEPWRLTTLSGQLMLGLIFQF